ncbi:hypothetical protein [Candidatus Rhabdochlamydia sp. T3358]|uniref:hypothetical protein n=1 Tax=Candidatus Rhabdochlamydia sp. T3358 TaxID=2099795 RepID=UPI0010B779FD|nr:hypothetical protein [Candidatus Rhabdochlamydia sp. T3358]VHO02830.1 hypothetical protein RHT_00683 [Candidatus Rhabdochlamydia sp. T3358]
MSQNLQLLLFLFLGILLHIINEIRKSPKHETIQPPKKIPSTRVHAKTTSVKPQGAPSIWEKEEDSLLLKSSSSRGKRLLNRSRLRQSILTSEILGRKY